MKTAGNVGEGADLSWVINKDIAKVAGKHGPVRIIHDRSENDTRLVRTISGWVTSGAQLGTSKDMVDIRLMSASVKSADAASYQDLQNKHELTFTDAGTTVYGNITNAKQELGSSSYVDGKLNNATTVTVRDGATWYGDLRTKVEKENALVEVSEDNQENFVHNTVALSNGANWYGATKNYGTDAKTNVSINDSAWTVTDNSAVTSITTHTHADITLADGVTLETGSLALANPREADAADTGFTIRVEGFNGTKLNVADEVAAGTINRLVAGAATNTGASVEAIAKDLWQVFSDETLTEPVNFTVEASAFGNTYEGTMTGEGSIENVVTYANPNTDHVADTTAITMMQWRAEATDLMERMGELRSQPGTNGLWTRVTGGRSKYNGIDNDFATLQFGYDHKIEAAEDVYVGGAFSYTEGDSDHSTSTGENNLFAVSGYATWLRDNGSYVDLAVRYGMLHNSFELDMADGKFDTQALSVALEGGHRFSLPVNTFVEPAIGLSYSHIFAESYNSSTDQGDVRIDQDGIDSTVARAGLRAGMSCPSNKGQVYLSAFYNYDFQAETSTTFGPFRKIDQDFGGGWYELGAGATVNFTDALRDWADFKYVDGGEIETPVRVTVGMRYMF